MPPDHGFGVQHDLCSMELAVSLTDDGCESVCEVAHNICEVAHNICEVAHNICEVAHNNGAEIKAKVTKGK